VAGGKYTTYRRMAEVITDGLVARLGRRRQGRNRDYRLDGAPQGDWHNFEATEPKRMAQKHRLSEVSALHLVRRYGRHAEDVARYTERDQTLAEPVIPGEPDLRAELAYQRDHEMAFFPGDYLLRRTRLGLFRPALLKKTGDR